MSIHHCPHCNSSVSKIYDEYLTNETDRHGNHIIIPCVPEYRCDNVNCDFTFIEEDELALIDKYINLRKGNE